MGPKYQQTKVSNGFVMPENQGLDTHIDDITNLDIFQFLPHVVVGGFFFCSGGH